jgi:hypothetical protein
MKVILPFLQLLERYKTNAKPQIKAERDDDIANSSRKGTSST